MKVKDINPHIRFASQIVYKSEHKRVYARDCRIFYIVSGEGEVLINEKRFRLLPATVFYCACGVCYSIESVEGIEILALNFDLTQKRSDIDDDFALINAENDVDTSLIENFFIEDCNFMNSYIFNDAGIDFEFKIRSIIDEFRARKIYYRERCSSLVKDLLISIQRVHIKNTEGTYGTVAQVISYINSNYQRNITNSFLAGMTGYHAYHLNRLFIKYTGTSIHRYILTIRINEAKKRIANTDSSLKNISEEVGFNNKTYFSRYFKKETGMSPSEYRKKFKNMM